MSRVGIVAFGALSALGEGEQAVRAGQIGERARVAIVRDEEFVRAALANPFVARANLRPAPPDPDLRATALLSRALGACAVELDRVRPGWRSRRVGLVLGTSSGGMRAAERAFATFEGGRRVADVEAPTYFGPMARAARDLGIALDPAILVLGACASSAIALGLACRWLERDACDVALAGGFDDVTVFVGAGFEALRATTASPPPRPFRLGRDGMALGEGAAVVALVRAERARAYVAGFGAASDAVHITAPHRDGDGLARAAAAALEEAGRPRIDLVGAHATATAYNDAAEARALVRALGDARAREVVVHPFKAQVGHTLGAAGALETLACLSAMESGVLPAAAGEGAIDPATPVRLLERSIEGHPRAALKLASAFGGANAALVVSLDEPPPRRAARPAFVHAAVHLADEPALEELAAATPMSVERLGRTDGLVRRVLGAVARLQRSAGRLAGAGVVVGSALATVETNASFAARLRARGARAVEPRLFPYTSPNAAPGECSIAFGLTGPGFAVGGGLHAAVEALAAGALLVEAGDADRVVVVAADDAGPTARALGGEHLAPGAVAVLLSAEPRGARATIGQVTLTRGAPVSVLRAPGHLALLPLASGDVPCEIASASPPDAQGRIELLPR